MNRNQKLLFLTTEIPFPLDSGGKIRTYNMIKGISEEYSIDLICFSENNENDTRCKELFKVCSTIKVIKSVYTNSSSKSMVLKNIFTSILKNKPFIIEKFINKEYENQINKLISNNKYDAVIFDHLNITGYYRKFEKTNMVKILSQHNCEYLILRRRYENEKNFIKKLYLKYEYKKTERYEKEICLKFSKVIVLTEEDRKLIYSEKCRNNNVEIIPISVDTNYLKKSYNSKIKKILFLGTMSWYPNEQGILWFLENVWEKVIDKYNDVKLYIVGKNPGENIMKYESNKVIVTGYVEDVNDYIEKCDVCIVPLFIGGGMRVKILECMSKGLPVISTSIGAEGIKCKEKEEILIANTPEKFLMCIDELYNNELYKLIAKKSVNLVNQNYSLKAISNKLINLIKNDTTNFN